MKSCDSCDTFVVLADRGRNVIFGKNSDRPLGEVQEVVLVPSKLRSKGKLQCTYIDIPQSENETISRVVLSKPAWMWGAEMGANEHGVAIGNEAVWNRLSDPDYDAVPRLLGMDLLRLGLERGKTAFEALQVITELLEKFGQGGPCSDIMPEHTYHNSFLIADPKEAWVLETARTLWVAEKVTSGYRNISNCMSIRTKIDLMSQGLKENCLNEGWWDGKSEFDWSQVIGEASKVPKTKLATPKERFQWGQKLLDESTKDGNFDLKSMMKILRHKESCICRTYYGRPIDSGNPTTGSMISILSPDKDERQHWLTGTPDPSISIFKPFSFESQDHLYLTKSPSAFPQKAKPEERAHPLWKAHERIHTQVLHDVSDEIKVPREHLETQLIEKLSKKVDFDEAVQMEMDLYNKEIQFQS